MADIERSLILIKPDALQRGLVGEIVRRFEQKGLKIIGMKMIELDDVLLDEHYKHHKDKPFFDNIKRFMKSSPVIALALEGRGIIEAIRLIVGSTKGAEADAGTIRGDLAMTNQNLVHASDSLASATEELQRFFAPAELFTYAKCDSGMVFEE